MLEKIFLSSIEFRNAKYQGYIRDNFMHGIGIIIDIDYMLALTSWNNDVPYGSSLIIFSNGDYVYGRLKNKRFQDICSYVTTSG